jgi:hypothetical protein
MLAEAKRPYLPTTQPTTLLIVAVLPVGGPQ